MLLTDKLPSEILAKLEQGKKVFCKFGEILQIKANLPRIKYADFVELYVRSYGNPYFDTDVKGHPQGYADFKALTFREKYPELFLYVDIDQTGLEAQFDAINTNADLLPTNIELKTVDLSQDTNIAVNIISSINSYADILFTNIFAIDSVVTAVNDKILLFGQTDKKQNGTWKVSIKNNLYIPGGHVYNVDDLFLDSGNVYVVTTGFTSTDIVTDAPNFTQINQWQQATAYAVNDYVFFEGNNNSFQVYKCTFAHTSSTVFQPPYFNTGVNLNIYDFWVRDQLVGHVNKPQYINVVAGTVRAGFNYQINIPVTKFELVFGSDNADLINVILSAVPLAMVPGILTDQATIKALSDRVEELYNSKWFPKSWLE